MSVSVCLAAYNGSAYIGAQLDSILDQLDGDDEVIVIDDGSVDDTLKIVRSFGDPRIRIFENSHNMGVNFTFARAMALATKDFVFLSDQDDLWTPGRKALMLETFDDDRVEVVAGNYRLIDRDGAPLSGSLAPNLSAADSQAWLRNLARIFQGRQNYYGCAMAFRRSAREKILPLPAALECHDIWIGMIGIVSASIMHLESPILLHRVHGNNASIVKRRFSVKLMSRAVLGYHLIVAVMRTLRNPTRHHESDDCGYAA